MSFLGTVTVFGTPNDVTLSELALEMLFPADDATARIAQAMVEEQEQGGVNPGALCAPPLAPCRLMVHIGGGRLAKDVPLANRVRSGRKQP